MKDSGEKEYRRLRRAVWMALKTVLTAICWFWSSILVAPIYLVFTQHPLKVPETGFLFVLWFYGGAIAWFVVLYLLVSLFLWWGMKRFYPQYREE